MSDTVDLSPTPGAGGLDADGGGADPGDLGALDTTDPADALELIDPDADAGAGAPEASWTDGLPDALRDVAQAAGWKGPEDAIRSYDELRRLDSQRGREMGELRDQLADLAAREQPHGPDGDGYPGEPQNKPVPTMEQVAGFAQQVAQAVDQGEIDVGEGMARVVNAMAGVSEQREQALLARVERMMGEHTAPLDQHVYETSVGREVQAIRNELGQEMYDQLKDQASALLQEWSRADPDFIRNPRSIRSAFNEVAVRAQVQQRREASGRVLDRSSRSGRGRGRSEVQTIVDQIRAVGGESGGGLDF